MASVTRVYELWEPEAGFENYLVLTIDGHVLEVSPTNTILVEKLQEAKDYGDLVQLGLSKKVALNSTEGPRQEVVSVKTLFSGNGMVKTSFDEARSFLSTDPMSGYRPTIVPNRSEASGIFRSLRPRPRRRSQCYSRAHVWAYEMWLKHQVKSTKVFLFFTRRYIRRYRYKWWFHVTPAIHVGSFGNIMAMDRRFTSSPHSLRSWTNIFMKNNAYCPMIRSYSYYRSHQYRESCYLIQSSMYFWQPVHLSQAERRGKIRKNYVHRDLRFAYSNGFGRRVIRNSDGTTRPTRTTYRRRRRRGWRWWRW